MKIKSILAMTLVGLSLNANAGQRELMGIFPACQTVRELNLVMKAAAAEDYISAEKIAAGGRCVFFEPGTKVTLIEFAGGSKPSEIMYRGRIWWVSSREIIID